MMLLLLTLGITYRLRDSFASTRTKACLVFPHTGSKRPLRAGAATHPDNFVFHLQAMLPLAVLFASILSTNNQTLSVYKHWCSEGVNHLKVVWELARTHTQLHYPHVFYQLGALQVLSPACYGGQLWLPKNLTTVQLPMWPSNHHYVSRWPYGTHSTPSAAVHKDRCPPVHCGWLRVCLRFHHPPSLPLRCC